MGVIRDRRAQLTRNRARRLRLADTDAEAHLWAVLGGRKGLGGWPWRRQVAFGPYILDFLCREAGVVVEVDGGQHNDQTAYDARRTAHLERCGFRVLRFWNSAILTNREGVCDSILEACGGEQDGGEPPLPRAAQRRREGGD